MMIGMTPARGTSCCTTSCIAVGSPSPPTRTTRPTGTFDRHRFLLSHPQPSTVHHLCFGPFPAPFVYDFMILTYIETKTQQKQREINMCGPYSEGTHHCKSNHPVYSNAATCMYGISVYAALHSSWAPQGSVSNLYTVTQVTSINSGTLARKPVILLCNHGTYTHSGLIVRSFYIHGFSTGYTCIYIYTYMYTYVSTCRGAQCDISSHLSEVLRLRGHIYIYTYISMYMYYLHIYICVHIHLYVIYIYICMCVYINWGGSDRQNMGEATWPGAPGVPREAPAGGERVAQLPPGLRVAHGEGAP